MFDSPPPIPAKRFFTIGEVSELCGVKPHVLRYWEQEFTQLHPAKRRGNQRYYQHHEILLIRRVRELLYEQGFTISGARNRLDGGEVFTPIMAAIDAESDDTCTKPNNLSPIPAKRFFTIGEVSELCGVKPHVLRYWEQEFSQLNPVKRRGNRRYYQHHELLLIRRVRDLLYEQGFTISGARNLLEGIIAEPLHVKLIGVGETLGDQLRKEPSLVHQLTPEQFEELICDRLFAMGFEPRRIGAINRKDGGVDVLFWPRMRSSFPFLGAAQVKHHRNPNSKEGPATVREFSGTLAGQPFNAGLLVTNTSFSPDAEWFAREHAKLMKLRDFNDIRRWLLDNFTDEAEWREIPSSIELCPGVVIKIR